MTTQNEMALSIYRYRIGLPPRDETEARRFEIFGGAGASLVERMDRLAESPTSSPEALPDTIPEDWHDD